MEARQSCILGWSIVKQCIGGRLVLCSTVQCGRRKDSQTELEMNCSPHLGDACWISAVLNNASSSACWNVTRISYITKQNRNILVISIPPLRALYSNPVSMHFATLLVYNLRGNRHGERFHENPQDYFSLAGLFIVQRREGTVDCYLTARCHLLRSITKVKR